MNKFEEFESKKFLIILFLICALFFVLIIAAFQYIPEPQDNTVQRNISIEDINKPASSDTTEDSTADENSQNDQKVQNQKKELNIKLPKYGEENEKLENIEELPSEAKEANETSVSNEEKPAELTVEEKANQTFYQGIKYKNNKQYVKAIEEFQKIPSITNDTIMNAKSLEEIATIYAIVKRYGTALSYAQKAYNMSPSSSREMLLARLYYKTGDIDKATKRINNVLQRDFSADR